MKQSSPYIIPFYIPHKGCPHRCVYCNVHLTAYGQNGDITKDYFDRRVAAFLETRRGRGTHVEVAFYGGSFNAIDRRERDYYLSLVRPYVDGGKIDYVRVSLRPDQLDCVLLDVLAKFRVKVAELGVQSMNDDVLQIIERGHDSKDVGNAIAVLRKAGIKVSAHIMVGLPGESRDRFFNSLNRLLDLKPEFVRMNPTLILKGTKLEKLYRAGAYEPLPLGEAVEICSRAYKIVRDRGVDVTRIGLQANEILNSPDGVVAGPYHPAFGELVLSRIVFERLVSLFQGGNVQSRKEVQIQANPSLLSKIIGDKKNNIRNLSHMFGLERVKVVGDSGLFEDEIMIL